MGRREATSLRRCVLHVQPVAERGGSDQLLLGMVRQLSTEGWECHVAFPGRSPLSEQFLAAGAHLHVVPMRRLTTSGSRWRWVAYAAGWPVAVLRLVRLGRETGAGLVHSNSLHSWYGWAAAVLLRRPHVWHAREIVVQSPAALSVERFLARRFASRVIAISGAVAGQLDPRNVVVVVDEPDPLEFAPERAGSFRQRVGIEDRVPLVSAASRIDTWKGIDVLVDSVPLLRASRPDVQVAIAGPPVAGKESYGEDLARRARALPGVHWLGARSDVAELMADSDVFVQASTWPEPYGMVIVEALSCGTPVVASDAGGPVEILAGLPSSAGRLVRPGDAPALAAAVAALLPPGASSSVSRRARKRLRQAPAPRWPEIFGEVLASAGGDLRPGRLNAQRPAASLE